MSAAEIKIARAQKTNYPAIAINAEMITVTAGSLTLTTIPDKAIMARVQCQGGNVRFWENGTAPTASAGRILYDGNELELFPRENMENFKFILDTATASEISVQYYK